MPSASFERGRLVGDPPRRPHLTSAGLSRPRPWVPRVFFPGSHRFFFFFFLGGGGGGHPRREKITRNPPRRVLPSLGFFVRFPSRGAPFPPFPPPCEWEPGDPGRPGQGAREWHGTARFPASLRRTRPGRYIGAHAALPCVDCIHTCMPLAGWQRMPKQVEDGLGSAFVALRASCHPTRMFAQSCGRVGPVAPGAGPPPPL